MRTLIILVIIPLNCWIVMPANAQPSTRDEVKTLGGDDMHGGDSLRDGFDAQLIAAKRELDQYKSLHSKMIQLKMPGRQVQPTEFLEWLQSLSRDNLSIYTNMLQSRRDLVDDLLKCWFASGNAGGIPKYDRDDLADNAALIIYNFETIGLNSKTRPFHETIKRGLASTVKALQSDYCVNAYFVLAKWVSIDQVLIVDHPRSYFDVPKDLQVTIYDAVSKWYASVEDSLSWSETRKLYIVPSEKVMELHSADIERAIEGSKRSP